MLGSKKRKKGALLEPNQFHHPAGDFVGDDALLFKVERPLGQLPQQGSRVASVFDLRRYE